jgi:hypothetical protein
MSAPDFIWAADSEPMDAGGVWVPWPIDATPYIRRDPAVIAELPETKALVAAALQRAVGELARHAKGTVVISGQTFRTIQLGEAITAILALIPTDHAAALEAVKAQAREEAANELQRERPFIMGANHGWDEGVADTLETVRLFVDPITLEDIAAAIRAGKVQP